ncbi:hypothetical protein [Blastopirellula marina]|uniref:Uncharacterized protein n=1 Tax=Blastopirellula marina DSM 3645 TaxID=314230 RepID=A3ZSK4_9BACT|nr:hypothetical protein [Blastopirellula marina]EAQ80664.1 hypothetical protein DSM3645_15000 [Blastopirellula marina DSM 3645]
MNTEARPTVTRADEKLQDIKRWVRAPTTAFELWEKVFSSKERARLGGDFYAACAKGGAVKMWQQLHGCTDDRAVIDIAFAVNFLSSTHHQWLLKETGELLDAEAAFEDAIIHNDLVLNSVSREIYWKSKPIELDWSHEAKWAFIWELARHAKANQPIDRMTFGNNKASDYVSKTKSELKCQNGFPKDLAALIKPSGMGTQKLAIPAAQIRLFEHHVGGEIREWTP